VTSVAFAPDGRTLLVVGWHSNNGNDTSPSDIELWSIPEKRVLQSFKSQVRYLDTGAFSPDGTMVAVTGTVEIDGPAKTMVEIWQVATGALLRRLSSSAVNLSSVKFSPDGSLLVAAGTQGLNHDNDIGILEAWSVLDGRLIRTLTSPTNQGLSDVAFAPDGNTIAAAGGQGPDATSRGIVDIWNLRTGRHVKRVKVGDKYAISLQYSGAGGVILVGTNKRLCVYDAHTGSLRRYYDQETGSVCSLSLGPHRASLAYRRIDGRIVVADNPYAGTYRFKR
jgi:WD40 repeat protein